jgi:phosphohistidine phosphatase
MSNQKLIIMRHGKSDWAKAAQSDFDRPLSGRGRKDAPHMGAWLEKKGLVPDLIISSPALRARETAELVADALGYERQHIVWSKEIYDASLADLLAVLADIDHKVSCLLLIGHNPGLDSLLEYLSQDKPEYWDGKLLTTAALAVLSYGDGPIRYERGSGRLEMLIRPR